MPRSSNRESTIEQETLKVRPQSCRKGARRDMTRIIAYRGYGIGFWASPRSGRLTRWQVRDFRGHLMHRKKSEGSDAL